MQRIVFFAFLAAILTMNLIFGLILTSKVVGPGFKPPVEPDKPSLTKSANIQVSNAAAIDFWEYKSQHLSCLISVHVYTTQGSFTQVSCVK